MSVGFARDGSGDLLAFCIVVDVIGLKTKRIRKRDWIVPRVRVQINPAREPDGILGQEAPLYSCLTLRCASHYHLVLQHAP